MTDGSINHQKRFLLHITVSIEKKTASPGTICDDKETAMGYAIFVSQSSTCVRIIQAVSSCCVVTSDAQNAKPVGLPKPREPPILQMVFRSLIFVSKVKKTYQWSQLGKIDPKDYRNKGVS